MTRTSQPAPKLSCRAQMILIFISTVAILIGLVGVVLAKAAFEQWVQQPRCFDYARAKGVTDIEHLRFDGVGIASNRYRSHHCNFTDTRTNTPVLVRFEDADVPTGLDSLQVCCMIVPLIICGLIASVFWERYYRQSAAHP